MRVTVKLFAGLRERAGWGERELEAASIDEVWSQLGLGEEPAGLLYAVNQEYADRSTALAEGDEVAIIPPVSGGAFRLGDGPIDLAAVAAEVADDRAGDRDLPGNRAPAVARPAGGRARVRGLRRHGREGHGRDRRGRDGAP